MKSSATSKFWRAYHALPPKIRNRARKAYRLWLRDPGHPSLRFEPKGVYWSVRVDPGWRALGRRDGDTMYWFWIGPHDEYERMLRRR
jgi:hypothetical protein